MSEHIVESHQFGLDRAQGPHATVAVVTFTDRPVKRVGGQVIDTEIGFAGNDADMAMVIKFVNEIIIGATGVDPGKEPILPPEKESAMKGGKTKKGCIPRAVAKLLQCLNALGARHPVDRSSDVKSRSSLSIPVLEHLRVEEN